MHDHNELFIGGSWRPPLGTEVLDVYSPATEERIGRVPLANADDMAAAISSAREAFDRGPWPRMSVEERRDLISRAGTLLEAQADALSDLITHETGLPRKSRKGHSQDAFAVIRSVPVPAPEERTSFTGARARIVHEPMGVVAAIVPWNGPLSLALSKVLPALLSGCTVVLKPAPETPLDTYPLAQAFADVGLPAGVLSVVPAGDDVSEGLVRDNAVDFVSFTGSSEVGRRIATICGSRLRRSHLELGGKSAAIMLEDVDAGAAAQLTLAGGMLLNNGEACAAWTRILVPESRHDEIVESLCEHIRAVAVGDPFDDRNDLGPLVADRQRDRFEGYVRLAQEEGAKIAIGGGRPAGLDRGWYVEPTLIVDADNSMRSSREEIFGPIASVIKYRDVEEALEIANDSEFGLSGAVLTRDDERGIEIASRIRSGTVGVNSIGIDPAFPFGGFKDSGIGRQFGTEGLHEYLETKTIGLAGASVFSR